MAAYYDKGKYRVRCTGQVLAENNKGNPELQLTVQPLAVYQQNEAQDINAEFPRTIYLTLTEATIGTPTKPGWVLETLRFLGFAGTSFDQLDPESQDAFNLVGVEFDAICQHDTYEGKEREKWGVHRGGQGLTAKPLEKKGLKALDAKFGKVLKATAGSAQPAAAATVPATADSTAAPPADDQIPF